MGVMQRIYDSLQKFEERDLTKYKEILFSDNRLKYVIGKNEQSEELVARYKIDGLIDDYCQDNKTWQGIPVFRSSGVDCNSVIFNCVTSISPVLVRNNLESAGLKEIVPISELVSKSGEFLQLPWFIRQQREELGKNFNWWFGLYNRLYDQESKDVLADVLRFRLSADANYMENYAVRLRDQYFEEFMGYHDEVFVDAGGFDGDTTEEFITRYPDYRKVYLFEPSCKNITAAKERLLGRRDIDFRPVGLSDVGGVLHFNSGAGSASSVTSVGGESINVVALDKELADVPISFIKMDLEGWELHALKGSAEIIKKYKPKLAIAVYHAAKDFREVPQFILSINPDYRIYLRHYTQGWSETVMYFL